VSGIHQFVPVLHRGDAVGRHTLRLRDATRARGLSSHIFVDLVQAETEGETLPAPDYEAQARPGDVVVYQFATASSMAPWLAGRRETLVVNYHNVTPAEQLAPWDPYLALGQQRALADLEVLAARAALAVADSDYNQALLTEAGFAATAVADAYASADVLVVTSDHEGFCVPVVEAMAAGLASAPQRFVGLLLPLVGAAR